ncbi:phage tail tape measure protein [bacterium]|nr:phage tail tape measure protein [bacterium]
MASKDLVARNLVVKLTADYETFIKKNKEGATSFDAMVYSIEKNKKNLREVGAIMTTVGATLSVALGGASKAAVDFNRELGNVQTLIPGNTKRIEELRDAIQDMAIKTGKSTTDLTQGAYQVISAFGDTGDTVAILEASAKAATAGLATTTESINLLSAVTKGYGDVSEESVKKVSDLSFQTVKLGQTTFPELAASIGRVVPLASELKVSQEELFAVMATGTGVTGNAAEVSTQLRGVLQALMSPTKDMTGLIKGLGYENGKAMLEANGLKGSIEIIKQAAEASGKPLQLYISSIEGQTLALSLAGKQSADYEKKLGEMRKAAGATEEAFLAQTEGVNKAGHSLDQLRESFKVLLQVIGQTLVPALNALVKVLTGMVSWVKDLAKEHSTLATAITTLGAAFGVLASVIGPLLLVLPNIVSGLKLFGLTSTSVTTSLSALKVAATTTWAALTGPVGIAVVAIAAVGTAISALLFDMDDLKATFETFGKWVSDWWDQMSKAFQTKEEAQMQEINVKRQKAEEDAAWAAVQVKRDEFAKKKELEDAAEAERQRKTEADIARAADLARKQAEEEKKAAAEKVKAEKQKEDATRQRIEAELQAKADADIAATQAEYNKLDEFGFIYSEMRARYGAALAGQVNDTATKLYQMGLDWEGYAARVAGVQGAQSKSIVGDLKERYGGYLSDMQLKTAEQLALMGGDFQTYANGIIKEGGPLKVMMFNIHSAFVDARTAAVNALKGIGTDFIDDILHGNFRGALDNMKDAFAQVGTNIRDNLIKALADGLNNWIQNGLKSIADAFWKMLGGGSGGFFDSIGGALKSVLGGGTAAAVSGGTAAAAGGGAAASLGGIFTAEGAAAGTLAVSGGTAGTIAGLGGVAGEADVVATLGAGGATGGVLGTIAAIAPIAAGLALPLVAAFKAFTWKGQRDAERRQKASDTLNNALSLFNGTKKGYIEAIGDLDNPDFAGIVSRVGNDTLHGWADYQNILDTYATFVSLKAMAESVEAGNWSGVTENLFVHASQGVQMGAYKSFAKGLEAAWVNAGGLANYQKRQAELNARIEAGRETQSNTPGANYNEHQSQTEDTVSGAAGATPTDTLPSVSLQQPEPQSSSQGNYPTFDETEGSFARQQLAKNYNAILKNIPHVGDVYLDMFTQFRDVLSKYHTGGVVEGVLGQETIIRALAGEEVLTRSDPRHRDNLGGGLVVNISGNNISSELDLKRLARLAGEEIMAMMRARGRVYT